MLANQIETLIIIILITALHLFSVFLHVTRLVFDILKCS